jgi:citrate lyase subunit gamma (acyl carrier protein)
MHVISKNAHAGTLESSDAFIQVEPNGDNGIEISLESSVEELYAEDIINLIKETLEKMGIQSIKVIVQDKGALDFVIKARLQSAILRATDAAPDWSQL